ncbi:phospho-sugar mutase [Chlamydia sp. 17-3921]|uniref:phospho-sugar mutase n=1 Tax=Chlamydia sp. 17-3921 TaxID=2675798 RepID=UPI00191B2865|nr:phospho-sugar mutase [Chlamydia sp. 17-3921]
MKQLQQRIKALYDVTTAKNILNWLSGSSSQEEKDFIILLLQENPDQLKELFGETLVFGTGGLRSLMGVGTNRMNAFTVRRTTQGLSQMLHRHYDVSKGILKVVVGYDTRHHSEEFAHETAKVFSGNGIHVFLFKNPEPLALVSFTVRKKKAVAGVMITASHNPPEYNGYKVYMASGGQVRPPLDAEIILECAGVEEILSVNSIEDPRIHMIGKEYEDAYIDTVKFLQLYPNDNRISGGTLHLSYTPLHGTGTSMIPKVLNNWGYSSVKLVEEQSIPDGNFSTVRLPNPEDPEALTLGINQLIANRDDILIATDPDADRVGIVSLEEEGPYRFSGNQIACLLADHILKARSKKAPLTTNDKVVKSLVTTELLTAITHYYGADLINVGTGFKYIGEKIEAWRNTPFNFIFGAEESYGYLYGNQVEDKDAIISSALIAEASLQQKLLGKTLRHAILELYEAHGYFLNKTESIEFLQEEESHMKEKLKHMESLGVHFPSLQKEELVSFENYNRRIGINLISDTSYVLDFPKMSMLCYYFSKGSKLIVRPSGTESKIKFYFEILQHYDEPSVDKAIQLQREKESFALLDSFVLDFKKIFSSL